MTLFSPWKRVMLPEGKDFNLQKFFESLSFNLVSRFVGAMVRFVLIWVGLILIIISFLGGLAGFVFWLTLPFFSFPVYKKFKNLPENYISDLFEKIKTQNKNPIEIILSSSAGKFLSGRAGMKTEDLLQYANGNKLNLNNLNPKNFEELITNLVVSETWTDAFFNKQGIDKDDFIKVAAWWDRNSYYKNNLEQEEMGRPGIALGLTFGYTPELNKYSIDLSIPEEFTEHLIGRSDIVEKIERILSGKKNIFLIGQPGVGKRTVVLEFARRAIAGEFGSNIAYKRILELDYNSLLSESRDLNAKKSKFSDILSEAAYSGNTILMIRDIHRLTNVEMEGVDFTDIIENHLDRERLQIIAVSNTYDYERFIAPNTRLRKAFEKVEVPPISKEQALEILMDLTDTWERKTGIIANMPVLRKIIDESDRYITEAPFPEKALEIFDLLVTYKQKSGGKVITNDDVNAVLAEKTGISFASLTPEEKKRLSSIEDIIHERLVNQEASVSLIGKALRAKTVGVIKENRPLGSFLFLGPTGVGKTETAKVLANVYFGSVDNILRFDMAEFSGNEGMERLIGSVRTNRPGELTTAIKNHPASLLLLDEFEKATRDIANLFLAMLDEGFITDAFGRKINCRNIFVIGTSNAGAEYIRKLVGQGIKGEPLQKKVVNYVLESEIFSPEFLNRFDGVVVYEPLTGEHLQKIAKLMLIDLKSELKKRNIILEISDDTVQKLAADGYDAAYGARPMKRIVNLILGDLIGKAILDGDLNDGDNIRIVPGTKKEEFVLEKLDKNNSS
jgi:ATP-dependent Clp protease ATP-binding subunit ClpC